MIPFYTYDIVVGIELLVVASLLLLLRILVLLVVLLTLIAACCWKMSRCLLESGCARVYFEKIDLDAFPGLTFSVFFGVFLPCIYWGYLLGLNLYHFLGSIFE